MEDKSKDMTESTKRTYGGSQGIGWCRVLILTAGIWLLVWLLAAPVQAASFSKTAPVPGVQLSGTPSKTGRANSEAVKLASYYMKKYFPAWYKKYPNCAKGSSYLSHYAQMRWDITGTKVMSDPDGYRNKSAKAILKDLFGD